MLYVIVHNFVRKFEQMLAAVASTRCLIHQVSTTLNLEFFYLLSFIFINSYLFSQFINLCPGYLYSQETVDKYACLNISKQKTLLKLTTGILLWFSILFSAAA